MQTILLTESITVNGISISELSIRKPKVRDYLAIERIDGSDLNREVTLTANLASVTKETIEELDIGDYVKVQEVLKDFFSATYTKNLRLNVLLLSSVTGGGIEQFLDMEIEEFLLWVKVSRKLK